MLISTIGNAGSSTVRNIFSDFSASVSLPDRVESGSLVGRALGARTTVHLADGLNRADRDLALRLKNRPPGTWWALELAQSERWRGDGMPLGATGPDGSLTPILVDGLGGPVVAAWTTSGLNLR